MYDLGENPVEEGRDVVGEFEGRAEELEGMLLGFLEQVGAERAVRQRMSRDSRLPGGVRASRSRKASPTGAAGIIGFDLKYQDASGQGPFW